MSTTDLSPPDEAVIVLTRTYDAPRALVWEAMTDPRHVTQWYGGEGFTSPVCEMDVRVGGLWHHVMRAPTGMEFTIDSVFLEVVPPARLVWGPAKKSGPGAPPAPTVTLTLIEEGERTAWRMEARFETLADRDLSVQMGFGRMVTMGMERLAAVLRGMAA